MNASRFRFLPTSATRRSHSRWWHFRWFDRVTSGMHGRGLFSYRPSGAETPAERTKEDYPRIIPVELRYRVDDESEIQAQTLVSETRSDSAESRHCRFLRASELNVPVAVYIVSIPRSLPE